MARPPLPPFTAETAAQKVRLAEDAWNSRDPARVALAYTIDSVWRNRAEFIRGREAIEAFLTRKWSRELDYRLIKEVWAFRGNRIAAVPGILGEARFLRGGLHRERRQWRAGHRLTPIVHSLLQSAAL